MSLSNRLGLLGRKVGMMRIFTDDGDAVPVTVLDVSNNRVTQVKTEATDGYSAIQVAFGSRKASRVTKPEAGHLAKAGVEAGEILQGIPRQRRSRRRVQAGRHVAGDACSPSARRSTCRAPRSARASPAPSSATTSARSARRTATAVRTTCRARSRWRRTRAACSRARRCPATVATRPSPRRTSTSCASTKPAQLLLVRGAVPGAKNGHVVVRPAVKAKAKQGSQVMQLELLNEQGQATSKVDAPDTVFARDYNEALVHQVVVAFQANARQGTRAQKDRGRSSTRPRSRGARRAPAAPAPA